MNKLHCYAVLAGLILVFQGCSAGNITPTSPETAVETNPSLAAATELPSASPFQSYTHLWEYFNVYIDTESLSIEVVPDRSTGFAANVVKFLNNDPLGLDVSFNGTSSGPGYVDIDLDVTINHPLDVEEYNGYDVRGIFIGDGSGTMDYSPDLVPPVSGTDQVLLNADGYSRWFNPTEFLIPKIFGYIPGSLATSGYIGTATLNPYKYFGEGLAANDDVWNYLVSGADNTGYFLAGTGNTRNYLLRFPIPLPGIKYGYAVVANWSGIAPGFHPSHAEEAVALHVTDNSNLYYVDNLTNGGNLILDISVFDWDALLTAGIMEDYSIIVESTVTSSNYKLNMTEMTPVNIDDHWYSFHVEIPADDIAGTEGNEMWIIVQDNIADYTNPYGVPNSADTDSLAACFRYDLAVASEEPLWIHVTAPNGGEEWYVGDSEEITWETHADVMDVEIDLSLNGGEDFTHVISPSIPNSGSFTWDPIPDEASGNPCRIRVKDAADPGVYDVSDADFAILEPSLTLVTPNGNETWVPGTDEEITWTSTGLTGTVILEYSKDGFMAIDTIAIDETDDGSFMWNNLPCDISTTIRVRITSTDFPSVSDTSDDDLAFVETGWAVKFDTPLNSEWARDIEVDLQGNQYACATFFSPTWQPYFSLVKFNTCGELMWDWTWDFGFDIEGHAVDTDGLGNVYITGWCETTGGPADFDPSDGVDMHDTGSSDHGFLMKFASSGDYEWTVTWGGTVRCKTWDIEVRADGIFLSGFFLGTVDFDPDPVGEDNVIANGTYDGYLLKLSLNGDYQWVEHWGKPGCSVYGWGLGCADTGPVYMTGGFTGTDVDFDPGTDPGETDLHSSIGVEDIFVSSFTDTGDFQWANSWGSPMLEEYAFDVVVGPTGNCYVTGGFKDTVDFDPEAGPSNVDFRTSNGNNDAFLSAFDASGDYLWANTWGGIDNDDPDCLAIDSMGNIHVTGTFEDTVDFDPDPGETYELICEGDSDAFLSRFDESGDFQWAHAWGGDVDGGKGVDVSTNGLIYVVGYFTGLNIEFAPTGTPCFEDSYQLSCDQDMFVVKYQPDGCW